jgi:hypothetical protein
LQWVVDVASKRSILFWPRRFRVGRSTTRRGFSTKSVFTMTRSLAILSAATILAAAAHAQCLGAVSGAVQTLTPTGIYTASDEGLTIPAGPFGFTFPMAGALPFAPGATHAFLGSNGELYLTNATYGTFAPVDPIDFGITWVGDWRGALNASPRIAAFTGDLDAGIGGVWGVHADTTVANQVTFRWEDVDEFFGAVPGSFSFAVTLYSTGDIDFSYSNAGTFQASPFGSVGVSIGNQVGTGAELSQDLSSGIDSGSLGLLFEEFFGNTVDLEGRTLRLTPNGVGGYISSLICTGAYNQNYGVGCYDFTAASQALYEEFLAAPAGGLTGQSMKATPAGNGYTFTWGGGTYVTPTGAATAILPFDDDEADVTPSVPFPHVSGPVSTLSVCTNGFVNMGPIGNNWVFAYGSVFDLLNTTVAAFRSNADYDARPTASPTGFIKTEEIGNVLYVTWENVERYNGNVSTGSSDRFQIQLDLVSGEVTYVWDSMQGVGFGGSAVVGYSPAGTSVDPGSVTLATALPVTTSPDIIQNALALSASPAPVITLGGTGPSVPVTWTVSNVPDIVPPFGIGLSLLIFSGAPIPGGLDLFFLDMPGCNLNVASLDVVIGFPGLAPVDSLTLTIPQPLSPGLSFYSQALSLFAPGTLPNGQNLFGGILSNGVQTYFNVF